MVAIVSGNNLGLDLTSKATLGSAGLIGTATQGNGGDQVFLNAATGNLVIQRRDDVLAGRGDDHEVVRTYNSLGLLNDDNGDNWSLGVYAQQMLLTGTVSTAGSTLTRTGRDGSVSVYAWDAAGGRYLSKVGAGAHDTIVVTATQYVHTEGSMGVVERYSVLTGRLESASDADGNTRAYTYDAASGLLQKVVDASGGITWYDYTGTKLTAIRTEVVQGSATLVQSRVRYSYDADGRLSAVMVDLSPQDKSTADGKVYTTSYEYDGTSKRVRTLTQSDGSRLTFTYVSVGSVMRLKTITDAANAVTTITYDTVTRQTAVADPLGRSWVYTYDASGQLVKISSPLVGGAKQSTSFAYDADGNVISIVNGDGEMVTMTYDTNGNLTSRRDELGNVVTRTYDAVSNQLLTETVSRISTPRLINQGGIAVVGTALVKTSGAESVWDSSFRSSEGLTGAASVGFTAGRADKAFMVGLTTDPAGSHGYSTIDFAMYCTASGELFASENGGWIALGTGYQAGDALRVTYDGTAITYLKNGVVLRSITTTITLPLFLDTSFRDVGAKVDHLKFGQSATAGEMPLVVEKNVTSVAGTVTKTGSTTTLWDSSVRSLNGYTGAAQVSFRSAQTTQPLAVGLSTDPNADDSYESINYAIYCNGSGFIEIYESGTKITTSYAYATTDVLKVVFDGSKVQYLKNAVVMREVAVSVSQPLYLDSGFSSPSSKINALQFGGSTLSTVTAIANGSYMTVIGDTVSRTAGSVAAWDASVRSDVGYIGSANLSFKPAQSDKALTVGLTTTPSAAYDTSGIGWGFNCRSTGALEIWEDGVKVTIAAQTYVTGDQLQILFDGSKVKYLKNGAQLREVLVDSTRAKLPMYVGSSFYQQGGKITNVRFGDSISPDLTTRYVYDSVKSRQLRFVVSPSGEVTEYRYDAVTGEKLSDIRYTANVYTGSGFAESDLEVWAGTAGIPGKTVRRDYEFDARGLLKAAKEYESVAADGAGVAARRTEYVYDAAGQLLQTIEAAGSGSDEAGQPTTVYTYDGLGRVLTSSDRRTGQLTATVYNDGSRTVVTTAPGGATSTSTYDVAGRLLSVARSGGGTTSYAYDAAGQLLMSVGPAAGSTSVRNFWLYDEKGRQVASVDGDGTLTETSYDAADRVVSVRVYAAPVSQTLLYDGATGRPRNPALSTVRPTAVAADLTNWRVYDDAGRLVYEIGDTGAVVAHQYDGADRLLRSTRYAMPIAVPIAPSVVSVATLLSEASVVAAAQSDRVTRYFLDPQGRVAAALDGEGYLTTNTYDKAGRLVEVRRYTTAIKVDPRADVTLAGLGSFDAATYTRDLYFYDARNQQVGQVDAENFLTTTSYNPRGLVQNKTRYATALTSNPSWQSNLSDLVSAVSINGAVGANDRQNRFAYARDGRLLREVSYDGTVTAYNYDDRGLLTERVVGAGAVGQPNPADARVTRVRYDSLGRKTAELSAENVAYLESRTTTADKELVWTTRATRYAYDDADRLTSITDANGNRTVYYYDLDGRLTHTINALGAVQETRYNALGQKTAEIRRGTTVSTSGLQGGLNQALSLLVVADPAKDTEIRYGYDDAGRLVSVTDTWIPDTSTGLRADSTDTLSYNAFDEVIGRSTHLGVASSRQDAYTYDRRGLQTSTAVDAAPGGLNLTSSSTYDAFGRVIRSVDGRGKVSEFSYDRLGRQVLSKNAAGDRTSTSFDAFGQRLAVSQWVSHDGSGPALTTSYSYDKAARSVTMTTPEGWQATTTYSAFGQTLSIKDANNVVTSYRYDRNGNLLETKVDSTIVEQRSYDAGDRLVFTLDGLLHKVSYTYDAANRTLTRTVDPNDASVAGVELHLVTRWTYDAKGQAIEMIDPRGTITRYDFDPNGNTIRQTIDPTGLALTTIWAYDARGKAVGVTDPRGVETRYSFDKAGRRVQERVDPTGLNLTRNYTYDGNNQVSSVTVLMPGGTAAVTRYFYDDAGQLEFTVDPVGAVVKRQYDGRGLLITETAYANALAAGQAPTAVVANPAADRVQRFAYSNDGRLRYSVDASGAVVRNDYDKVGNLVRRTSFANIVAAGVAPQSVVVSAADRVQQFRYDKLNRQTWQADAAGALTRTTYDAVGNVLRETQFLTLYPGVNLGSSSDASLESWVSSYASSSDRTTQYSYDAANRRTSTTDALNQTESYAYDAAGNRTSLTNKKGAVWTYEYDKANRLVTETSPQVSLQGISVSGGNLVLGTAAQASVVTRLTYDANGKLTMRTEAYGRPEARTTRYEYDAAGRQVRVVYPSVNVHSETAAELAANNRLDGAARDESLVAPEVRTYYNSLGNAVASVDRNGATSYKAYDLAGRVSYEVDALGYVTRYDRNAFGEAISVTRYAVATTLNTTLAANAATQLTTAAVSSAVNGSGVNHSLDRVLVNSYDRLGRVVEVREPTAFTYDAASGSYDAASGKTTRSSFNAFGELVKLSELARAPGTWADAYHYYDPVGRRIASADAAGYLTTYGYDAVGNLLDETQFSAAMTAGSWGIGSYALPTTMSGVDRKTTWSWDALNRKLTESKVGVSYASSFTATAVTTQSNQTLTTSYAYDAVGNLTTTTDAQGGKTYSYYDALGRVTAVAAPARSTVSSSTPVVPVVEFLRDAYGNVVAQVQRAGAATAVSAAGYALTANAADRSTKTLYDLNGNATQVEDAAGNRSYASYAADGKLAKSWQTVTDNDGLKSSVFTSFEYDKVGQLINTYSPSPTGVGIVSLNQRYNGFGEVIGRGRNLGWQESFAYDNGGRLWKTNADDGVTKVYLYDLRGRQTAEIRSAGAGRSGSVDVAIALSAAEAAAWTSVRRVDTKYDLLGNVVERVDAERLSAQGGVTVRVAAATASITTSDPIIWGYTGGYSSMQAAPMAVGTTNVVTLGWADMSYLGSGEVKVVLSYISAPIPPRPLGVDEYGETYYDSESAAPGTAMTETQILGGHLTATGVALKWGAPANSRPPAGISDITGLVVYKKDRDGNWVKMIDRQPSAGRPFGKFGTFVEIGSPVDPQSKVTFKYRAYGSTGAFVSVSDAGLTKFGDSHWLDVSALASGRYEYQVWMTEKDQAEEQLGPAGDFYTGQTDTGDSAKLNAWERPVTYFTRDRWGNALSQSDPRNATWLTTFRYNRDNQVIEERRPDPDTGDINANSPVRTVHYDQLGNMVAVQDARGYVNGQRFDAGGNLVAEVHADGGVITHAYDLFGQKRQTIDAVGNAGAGSVVTDHTTVFDYDALGRLVRTTHGTTAAGSVGVWETGTDANYSLGLVERKNLQENYTYDELGRRTRQTAADGQSVQYWYDPAGNVVKKLQPGGVQSLTSYDAFGRKLTETDANGSVATWSYDYFGRTLDHVNIGGYDFDYQYDAAGQLVLQSNFLGSGASRVQKQKISYSYDAAGQLTLTVDGLPGAAQQTSLFAYDLAGHRLREKMTRQTTVSGVTYNEVFQDNHLGYDILGRLVDSADNRAHLSFAYDKADNRTKVTSSVYVHAVGDPDTETLKAATRYFAYDAMNRQTLVDGVNATGTINATQGRRLTYDLNGNRISDTFYGNKVTTSTYITYYNARGWAVYNESTTYSKSIAEVTERYTYDALDRLTSNERDGIQVDMRYYDAASRVVQTGAVSLPVAYADALNSGVAEEDKVGFDIRRQRYDISGRMTLQYITKSDGAKKALISYTGTGYNGTQLGYDAVGNVKAYQYANYSGDDYKNVSTIDLAKYEGYVEAKTTVNSNVFKTGSSTSTYDAGGYLLKVDDATQNTLDKDIVNDSAGRVLRVTQNGNKLWTHIVNGEMLGQHGVGPDEVDPRGKKGAAKFQQVAEFDFGFRNITGSYPAPSVGQYVVRQGDTLQTIAQAAYGDSSLWWRVAQANAINSDAEIRVGQTLVLPNQVAGSSNNAGTFKPYNPADVIGDTSPNLPQPKKKGCGAFGQVLMVVVAVAVSIVATPLAGGGLIGGALGAAAGSVASQAVGIATGAQEGFSWKSVALAAVAGGVSGGLASRFGPATIGGTGMSNTIVRAAVSTAASQGIGVASGLQERFSWVSVAASSLGAGIGETVSETLLGPVVNGSRTLETPFATALGQGMAAKVVGGTLAGMAGGLAVSLLRGGRISAVQIATDAFGNALGESIASQSQPEPQGTVGPISAEERASILDLFKDGPNGTPASTYTGGQAWAADVAARRADAKARQIDDLMASVGSGGVSVDSRPGVIYVQPGDNLTKIGARWSEYGSANDLKNQLIAANPQLSDPNNLQVGMALNFPDAGTVVDRTAMARAVGADGRYQAALAARAQPAAVAGGDGLSFDGLSFADLASGGASPSLGGPVSLSGMQRAQAHALGVYDAGAGAVEGAGYSFGVVGTPESRAAWAVKTAEATVEGIRRFANDPKGAMSGWWDNLTGDDPEAIRQATAQGAGVAIGVAGGVATGRLQGGLRVGTASELDMFRRVANQGAFADLPVLMDLKTVRSYASEAGIGLDGVKVRIVRDESLIGRGIGGYTHPNGKSIDLYPDAFSSPEELVRTIAHERMHVYQARTFGEPTGQIDLRLNENAAYGLEDSFVQYWRLNKGR